jgi:hypothetical protein
MLKRAAGEQAFREIREWSWSLRDKLHVITTHLELSRPVLKSMT